MAIKKYKIILETVGIKHKSAGETIEDALAKIDLTWKEIKGKGVVKIFKGKQKYERLFNVPRLRRLLGNKLTRELWARRFEVLLK